MITSKQIIKISEDWLLSLPSFHNNRLPIDVYVNPNSTDILELKKSNVQFVRFIADSKTKKLYVWNGEGLLHSQVAKQLDLSSRIDYYQSVPDHTLIGTADIQGGRLHVQPKRLEYLDSIIKDLHLRYTVPLGSYLQKKLDYFITLKDEFGWVTRYMDMTEIFNLVSKSLS